jgi:hypothetical protein
MPAFQAQTTASDLLTADHDQHRTIKVQNKGPNAIYFETGADAAVATGYEVAATTGVAEFKIPPSTRLSVIAATANQSTPADTRYLVT